MTQIVEVKTAELIAPALDWAVAKALGWTNYPSDSVEQGNTWHMDPDKTPLGPVMRVADWQPSTDWSQGGPLIEREAVSLTQFSDHPQWTAKHPASVCFDGPTPLIAAMRCLVASKLGDTVQVPQELLP